MLLSVKPFDLVFYELTVALPVLQNMESSWL